MKTLLVLIGLLLLLQPEQTQVSEYLIDDHGVFSAITHGFDPRQYDFTKSKTHRITTALPDAYNVLPCVGLIHFLAN